ncbi:hypothetical protein PM082_007558 [Marasmius tenuissimus]|nr:hypothetical protein PM082_007558 [Marasmius tenuissimus]
MEYRVTSSFTVPPSSTLNHARLRMRSVGETRNSNRGQNEVLGVDRLESRFSLPPLPCLLVPKEPNHARSTSSSPIMVDRTLDTGALPNDQYTTSANYSPHATPDPGPPSLPSRIGPDDDLLSFESDDASTPAPPMPYLQVVLKHQKLTTTSLPPAAPPHTSSHRTPALTKDRGRKSWIVASAFGSSNGCQLAAPLHHRRRQRK